MRYRVRPPEVEAREVTAAQAADVAAWCGGELVDGGVEFQSPTLPGEPTTTARASVGDWVAESLGPFGGFQVWPAEAFAQVWEPAP
jgi:hypothetical protein